MISRSSIRNCFFTYGLFALFLSLPILSFAQNKIVDSLQNLLTQKDLSAKDQIFVRSYLADAFSATDSSKAFHLNRKAIQLGQKHQIVDGLTFAWALQVKLEVIKGNYQKAIQAKDSALFYAKKADSFFRGIALYRKGYLENINNKPDSAIHSWHQAFPLLKGQKGAKYRSSIYNLLYGIYAERKDLKKATQNVRLSLKNARESNSPEVIISALQIKGTNYIDLFREKKDSVFIDSAIHVLNQAKEVYFQKKEYIFNPSVIALTSLYLANIYMKFYPPWYKDSINQNINLAFRVSKEAHNTTMLANAYNLLSNFNIRNGRPEVAEKVLLKEKKMIDKLTSPNYYLSMNLYHALAKVKDIQGNHKAALDYYKKYIEFYGKEYDQEQSNLIQKLNAKYQNEKKEKELALLRQKNKFQRKQTFLYFGIAIIAIVGLLLLFIAYHFRLKYSLQREKSKEEETARLQAEQELVQKEKEQLKKELLAGTLQLEHKNEVLQNLKEKLLKQSDSGSKQQLKKIINEEIRIDEDFENVKSDFKAIHPEFFTKLREKAKQKLTSLDLKYCTYIYMNLSANQIATLLHVEVKSVRMAKYRLKRKMGLGKEEDLTEFLQSND